MWKFIVSICAAILFTLTITADKNAFAFHSVINKGNYLPVQNIGKDSESSDTTEINHEEEKDIIDDTTRFIELNQQLANGDTTGRWPVDLPYPLKGAILPFNRIVAFYGNLYSTKMGILGEIPKNAMFAKLKSEIAKFEEADPSIPVIPALHYVAMTAQEYPGAAGKYKLKMPDSQIEKVISWSKEIDALTFLDIQVGLSTVMAEVPAFDKFLKMPTVHFGIDPEFSMKDGTPPGKKIGTYDASDINWVIDHLAEIVRENNLPPKILVIHRFTQKMVTNYQDIKKVPEVQVVMDMDGWGPQHLKLSTWDRVIYKEPVGYTGFKIFYKHDRRKGNSELFTADDVLKLSPQPVYIQYQ